MTGERILVVEDNEKNMKLFRDVLIATGFRTLEATTGGEAVDMASEHTPDLVLMDVQLPDLDGVQALHLLRANARTATIRRTLTAQAMQGDRERFLAEGFDGYMSKPVNVRELIEIVGNTAKDGSDERRGPILVVDDVAPNVRLLEAVLVPRGYDVVSATDGERALELVASAKPDLVMLDA